QPCGRRLLSFLAYFGVAALASAAAAVALLAAELAASAALLAALPAAWAVDSAAGSPALAAAVAASVAAAVALAAAVCDVAAAAAAALAARAAAQTVVDEIVVMPQVGADGRPVSLSRVVSFRDLDLRNRADQEVLRLRVRDTARELCRELGETGSSPLLSRA